MTSAPNTSQIFDAFMATVEAKKLTLYPAQEEAILALFDGANVILNTPTGSGKSLVAEALHFLSIKSGRRSFYTSPIKALVNEKFLALCRAFGAESVGMVTGDATVNADAPIICCTAEILANLALRSGDLSPVQDVIMDEFHYYADRDRGFAWQVPLLTLPHCRFLLMSATLGDTTFFENALTRLNQKPTHVIQTLERPVPLDFSYVETPQHETLEFLVQQSRAPVYVVHFTQRECCEGAQNLMSVDFLNKEEKQAIAEELNGVKFQSPYGKEFQRFLRHGVGVHHAGLLPKYRVLVEKLAQKGMLKMICGTDTLGVGVNIPIRSVLFTKLCKFDGQKSTLLSVRDFHQISGRAGRRGFDEKGYVVVQAPEHIVDNKRLDEKSAKSGKKFVKRKAPDKGYVPWDKNVFNRLLASKPESLTSQFTVSHAMLLNVLGRQTEDGCQAMRKIIRDCHETPLAKKKHFKRAFELFRSLVDRQIIEFAATSGRRKRIELNVDLQQDFSLNHALSVFLLDALKTLDSKDPNHSLNILSLCESILENPDVILRKQIDRLKTMRMAELKAAGVEYDERIAELEKIQHPKPLADFIYQSFNAFSAIHPWVGLENIRPKSIVREMIESFYSFADYIREYGLERAEGVLLRYLSQCYKVLVQTVPESDKSEEVEEIISYLHIMLQETDSSLLDEWEHMRNPNRALKAKPVQVLAPRSLEIFKTDRNFRIQLKNKVFQILRFLAQKNCAGALTLAGTQLSEAELTAALESYFSAHSTIELNPEARSSKLLDINTDSHAWLIQQTLSDIDGPVPWLLTFELDTEATEATQTPMLKLINLKAIP